MNYENNVMLDAVDNVTEVAQQLPQIIELPEETAGFGVLELVLSGVTGIGAGIGGTILVQKIRKHRAEKKAEKEAFKEFQAAQQAAANAAPAQEPLQGDVVDTPPVNN